MQGSDELCGYDHPQVGAVLRAQADAQRPIWEHSDTMFPSIYFRLVDPSGPHAAYECDDEHFDGPACRNISLAHERALQHSMVGHAVRASVGATHNYQPLRLLALACVAMGCVCRWG